MPTWRNWFNLKSKRGKDINSNFGQSEYLSKWIELLNSEKLQVLIDKYNLRVIFFLHRNMQKYIKAFDGVNKKIIIASWKEYDVQELLKESAMMITDYSSVFFDMIYMKKPIIFYQFDEQEYRKYQYQEGWFNYHDNPFGKTFKDYMDVLSELALHLENKFQVDKKFLAGHSSVFKYWDTNNSARIYSLLQNDTNEKIEK